MHGSKEESFMDPKRRVSSSFAPSLLPSLVAECGAAFGNAVAEGRPPQLMDMWEGEVPWGQLALTSLKV